MMIFSRDSVKTVLKLTFRLIAQIQACDVLRAYSVKVVLKLALRAIAQKQSCDVSRAQRDSSVDTSASFARESVKPSTLPVPCYARDSTTAVSLPAARVVA